jgi:hypothetical protein
VATPGNRGGGFVRRLLPSLFIHGHPWVKPEREPTMVQSLIGLSKPPAHETLGCCRLDLAWPVVLRQLGRHKLPAVAGGLIFITRDAYPVSRFDSIHISG